jgi:hypothetical protein
MPRVGFEPTIPVFEWAKAFHALDGAAIVIGGFYDESDILTIEAANRNTIKYTRTM